MASGSTHLRVALIADVAFAALALRAHAAGADDIAAGIATGAILATVITPDFDLVGTTITEKFIRRIPVFGLLLQISWYPYALLSKHRGLSHVWLLGTAMRIGYLILVIAVWTIFVNGVLAMAGNDYVARTVAALLDAVATHPQWGAWTATVWAMHDTLHLLFDTKTMKRILT